MEFALFKHNDGFKEQPIHSQPDWTWTNSTCQLSCLASLLFYSPVALCLVGSLLLHILLRGSDRFYVRTRCLSFPEPTNHSTFFHSTPISLIMKSNHIDPQSNGRSTDRRLLLPSSNPSQLSRACAQSSSGEQYKFKWLRRCFKK